MLKLDEICQLIRVVAEHKVGSLEIEQEGVRIRIEGPPAPHFITSPPLAMGPAPARAVPPVGVEDERSTGGYEADEAGLVYVTSPIVGTFYRAPNPEAPSFVELGALVRKGQVLCIVEAMKLMNEIESEVAGTVVRVLVENAQPVEFGQRLFAIRSA